MARVFLDVCGSNHYYQWIAESIVRPVPSLQLMLMNARRRMTDEPPYVANVNRRLYRWCQWRRLVVNCTRKAGTEKCEVKYTYTHTYTHP